MLVYIVGTITLFRLLGLPLLPIMLACALVLAALAYRTSRSAQAIRCFVGLLVAIAGKYLGAYALVHQPGFANTWTGHIALALQPNWIFGALTVLFMLYCVVIGVYGPPTPEIAGTPLDIITKKRRNREGIGKP